MCQNAYDAAAKAGKGMNIAEGYGKVCLEKLAAAKPYVNTLGGAYKTNFDKKCTEATEMCKKAADENKKIYYESEVPASELPKPDP